MLPYLLIFSITIGLTYISQKAKWANKRNIKILLSLGVIFTISLFAALRDYSVGADIMTHKTTYYDTALSTESIQEYLGQFNNEYAFSALVYMVAHVFGSYRVIMFILTFVPLSVLFYYGQKYYPKHMALLLAIYLMMFFNTSLNVIRQVMAISCIIPAFFSLQDGKKIRSLLLIAFAALFHISAIFMLIIYPIYYFSKKDKQKKYYLLIGGLFIVICSLLGELVNQDFMEKMGYSGYLRSNSTNMILQFFILKLYIFIFVAYFYKYYKNEERSKNLYYFIILDLLFYFFSNYVMYGYRLSYYFVVFYPFMISSIAEKVEGNDKKLLYLGLTISMILYWVDRNMIIGYDSTIPYVLGI